MGRVCLVVAGLALALGVGAPAAAVQPFPLGKLTGSVTSASDPAQHYAVYMPSSYDAKRPAPLIQSLA